MRGRHAGGSILLGLGLVLAAISCDQQDTSPLAPLTPGDDPSASVSCVPGQTRDCTIACPPGTKGYQVCSDEGSSYGGCVCSSGALLPSSRFSVDRSALGDNRLLPIEAFDDHLPLNTPGRPLQGAASVGAACAADDDCSSGLICFDVTDGLSIGGPAGGYCTRPCSTPEQCEQLDLGSTCGTLAGQPLCIRLCEAGPLAAGEVKCLGREDLTCLSLEGIGEPPPSDRPDLGLCTPRCQSDEACGGDPRCDLASGLCTVLPATARLPVGSPCTTGADCQGGICFAPFPGTERVCSAFCTLGVPGCGFDGNEPTIDAGCAFPVVPDETDGDRGACLELCDADADCAQPNATCVQGAAIDGRTGVCVKQVGAGQPPPPPPPPPDPVTGSDLGKPCGRNSDCGGDLACLASDSNPFGAGLGGPAEGYCSKPCDAVDECPEDGVCVSLTAGGAICLRACEAATPGSCGRETAQCADIGVDVCLPDCTSSEGCGARVCDPEVGLCVDALPPECSSDAECDEGEQCDVASGECVTASPACATDAECATGQLCDTILGRCFVPEPEPCVSNAECPDQVCNPSSGECIPAPAIPIGGACVEDLDCAAEVCPTLAGSSFCSGVCALGTPVGCEPYGADAFCLLPLPNNPGIGLCLELCNTPADCAQPEYICTPLDGEINGNTGACLPPPPAQPPAAPAP